MSVDVESVVGGQDARGAGADLGEAGILQVDAGGRGEEVVANGGLDDFGKGDGERMGPGVARVEEASEVDLASTGAPRPREDGPDGSLRRSVSELCRKNAGRLVSSKHRV